MNFPQYIMLLLLKMVNYNIKDVKLATSSQGGPEGSLFDSYNTEM